MLEYRGPLNPNSILIIINSSLLRLLSENYLINLTRRTQGAVSSVWQSTGLLIRVSWVRPPHGPPQIKHKPPLKLIGGLLIL